MPESPAVTQKIANTSTVPAIEATSGLPRTRCHRDGVRTRSSERAVISSTVLPGELLDLADVFLGHEPRAGADVPGTVDRGEVVGVEPRLGLGVRLERGDDLRHVVR